MAETEPGPTSLRWGPVIVPSPTRTGRSSSTSIRSDSRSAGRPLRRRRALGEVAPPGGGRPRSRRSAA